MSNVDRLAYYSDTWNAARADGHSRPYFIQSKDKSCQTERQFRLNLATHLVNKAPVNEMVIRHTGEILLCISDKEFILMRRQRERK